MIKRTEEKIETKFTHMIGTYIKEKLRVSSENKPADFNDQTQTA